MLGESKGPSIQVEVKKYMTSLFSEYVKSNSKWIMLVAPSPCSSLDTSTSGLSGSSVSTQGTRLLDSLMQYLKQYKSLSGGVDARIKLHKHFVE